MTPRQAVFLDRDGTLIYDRNYLADPDGVALLPGIVPALRALRNCAFALVLVSNQSGVGRGFYSAETLALVDARLQQLLLEHEITLDGTYYCLHAPWEGCACRKPNPGMLQQAVRDLDLDMAQSWMIGDKLDDVLAGKRAGCRAILLSKQPVATIIPDQAPDYLAPDFVAASKWVVDSVISSQRSDHRVA